MVTRNNLMIGFSLTLLLTEEITTAFLNPILGLAISFLGAIVIAVLPYVMESDSAVRASMQCFSLLFLTRVAITILPAIILPPYLVILAVYSVYLAMSVIYILERHLPLRDIGFHASNVGFQILGGLGLGVVMGVVEFLILLSDMNRYLLFQGFSFSTLSYNILIMFLFVGLGEELLFRGLAQTTLEKQFRNRYTALIIISLSFSIMHLGYVTSYEKILEIAYVFAASTIIGYSFMRTRSLLLPFVAHGLANTILFGILPYLA